MIVNYLHKFYTVAYMREPTIVEICHFSLTCDLLNGNIFVHWRDQDIHHMELVFEFSLRKEVEVQEARTILRNIVEYATTKRLESIKAALPSFAEHRPSSETMLESTTAPSVSSSLNSHPWLHFETPATPTSVASEPVKKKRRGPGLCN